MNMQWGGRRSAWLTAIVKKRYKERARHWQDDDVNTILIAFFLNCVNKCGRYYIKHFKQQAEPVVDLHDVVLDFCL